MSELYFSSQAEADRYALEQQLEKHKLVVERLETRLLALSAPVYRLSDDLLLEVFKAGRHRDGGLDMLFSVLVSHVVARWRRVALSSPTLWTSIRVRLRENMLLEEPMWTSLSERSLPLPIHIFILFQQTCSFPVDLEPAVERCETMRIKFQGELGAVADSAFPTAPRVRALYLSGSIPSETLVLRIISSCPKLRILITSDLYCRPGTQDVPLEVPLLETMRMAALRASDVTFSLNTPLLRNLILYWPYPHRTMPTVNDPSRVERLSLSGKFESLEPVIHAICILPRLKEVHLNIRLVIPDWQTPRQDITFTTETVPPIARLFLQDVRCCCACESSPDCVACTDKAAQSLVDRVVRGGSLQSVDVLECTTVSEQWKHSVLTRFAPWPRTEQKEIRRLPDYIVIGKISMMATQMAVKRTHH